MAKKIWYRRKFSPALSRGVTSPICASAVWASLAGGLGLTRSAALSARLLQSDASCIQQLCFWQPGSGAMLTFLLYDAFRPELVKHLQTVDEKIVS